jgi:hypothetical protein
MNTETPDTPPITLHLSSCLRHESAKDKAALLHKISASDWPLILEEADRHGVAPLLYFAVRPHARGLLISKDLMTAMRRKYLLAVARNLHLFQELSSLLAEFNRDGIPVVLLKGAHLAGEVYDDMGLRNMCDIDLLVKRADLMRVERLLLSRGADPEDRRRVIGSSNKHFGYQLAQSGLRVEIHWALVTGDLRKIEWEETESRLRTIVINSVPALALCPEDLLLHLCLHAAGHLNALHVRMLCDMVAVGQKYGAELDWPELVARAKIWGASRAAYVMLRLARERLGAPLPAHWIEALRTEDMNDGVVSIVAGRFFSTPHLAPPDLSIGMARFRSAGGLRARMKYVATRVFVSPEIMAFKYGAPLHSWRILLFYPARLVDLWGRHGKFLRQTMFGGRRTQTAADHISKKSEATDKLRDWLLSRVS